MAWTNFRLADTPRTAGRHIRAQGVTRPGLVFPIIQRSMFNRR